MAREILMPKVDFDMKEGSVMRWLVTSGTVVRKGDPIADIETHKVVVQLKAPIDGVLEIKVEVGQAVPVGAVIAVINVGGSG